MAATDTESLAYQMQSVKDLYTELFTLLLTSVEEPTDADAPDQAIDQLMLTIDGSMRDFLSTVRSSRADKKVPEALDGEILQFEEQLKEGLGLMHTRVQSRMTALAQEREELKGRLKMIQLKRGGNRGYRKGMVIAIGPADDPVHANA